MLSSSREYTNSTTAVLGSLLQNNSTPLQSNSILEEDDHFVLVEDEESFPTDLPIPLPSNFPKNARFLGSFTKLKKFQDGNESFHPTYTGMLNGKKFFIKFNIDPGIKDGKKHYLITKAAATAEANTADPYLKAEICTQLEAACWRWYRIAAPDIVSNAVHPCFAYDPEEKKYVFIAVAAEEIPGFRPNRFDPLQEGDLRINFLHDDLNKKREKLIKNLKDLSERLVRTNDPNGSYFSSIWNTTKQACTKLGDSLYGTTTGAPTLKPIIDELLEKNKKEPISENEIHNIVPQLFQRLKHIENTLLPKYQNYPEEVKKYKSEILILKEAIENATPDIKKLEEIDEIIDQYLEQEEQKILLNYQNTKEDEILSINWNNQTVQITAKELRDHRLIDKLKEDTKFAGKMQGESFSIMAKDILNYRGKGGLAEAHVQSHINAENDYHNKNGSKKGKRIDFDMSEWPFFSKFKEVNWAEWLKQNADWVIGLIGRLFTWSQPTEAFPFTQNDFANFPNLQDDKRRYWPTESTSLAQVSKSTSLKILRIPFFENFYTSTDIRLFQGLSADPVYTFHACKKYLYNLVIPEPLYRESMKLEVKYDQFYVDSATSLKKNLIDDGSIYKVGRLQNLKNMLFKSPQFREFLESRGDYAFSLIMKSFEKDKNDPDLKDIIDLDEIRKEYDKVLIATGIRKDLSKNESFVHQRQIHKH